jgi:hypothetical protein
MMMSFYILAPTNSHGARVLREAIVRLGGQIGSREDADAYVSYGVRVPNPGRPTLNANGGMRDKFLELQTLQNAGVPVPLFSEVVDRVDFPYLARKRQHTRGQDIVPILGPGQLHDWARTNRDFFVRYTPFTREFRVWVYRRRTLAIYEKVLRYPERVSTIGAHFENGFAFIFRGEPMPEFGGIAANAVHALELDFGAVDVLDTPDGPVVLEVNTAPGVEGLRHGITKLATKIMKWAELDYPRRRGTGGE